MVSRQPTTERGAVALITAMVVSVLLMITTAGMVSLTVKSMRQSTDGAQSTKAYYAAEGALEEAILNIKKDPNYTGSCPGGAAAGSAKDAVITCILVNQQPNQVSGTVGANETVQIDLSAVSNLASVKIDWGLEQGYNASSIPNYAGGFPEGSNWPATAPALMEAALVEYPNSAEFAINQVGFYQAVLGPQANSGPPFYHYINGSSSARLSAPIPSGCTGTAPYQCTATAGGLGNTKRFVLRLKARYNKASYRVSVFNGSNQPTTIPGAMYTVDVTARAGDVFRRVQTSFPVDGGGPEALKGLDYVLYSDTSICKDFEIEGVAQATGLCQVP